MFCPNCGTQLPDNAAFCSNCGKSFQTESAMNQDTQQYQQQGETGQYGQYQQNGSTYSGTVEQTAPDKKNNTLKIVIGVVVALVLILILRGIFGGSYKTPVKTFVKTINKQSTEYKDYSKFNAPKYQNSFQTDYYAVTDSDDLEDYYDQLTDQYKDIFDDWEDTYGKNWKVTVEIDDVEKIDKDDLDDIVESYQNGMEDKDDVKDSLDDLESELDDQVDDDDITKSEKKKMLKIGEKYLNACRKVKVTKGYTCSLKFTIKGKDGKGIYRAKDVNIIKVNGEWIFDGSYNGDSFGADSLDFEKK